MELVQELLPQPTREQCLKIYNAFNPTEYEKNLQTLKTWFEERTCTPCDANYENQLNVILRGSKNDVIKAQKRLKSFFVYKTKFPEFYAYYDLNGKFQEFTDFHILCQPGITSDGHRVIFLGFRTPDIDDFDVDVMFKSLFMLDHLGLCLAPQFLLGIIVVIDMANASAKHALKILTWRLRRYAQLTNEVMPFRLQKLFMINVPSYLEKFVNIGKAFLTEKLRSRFYIEHADIEMRKHVPSHLLPADYGGGGESISTQCEKWFKLIAALRPWFEAEQKVLLQSRTKRNASATGANRNGTTASTPPPKTTSKRAHDDTDPPMKAFAHLDID